MVDVLKLIWHAKNRVLIAKVWQCRLTIDYGSKEGKVVKNAQVAFKERKRKANNTKDKSKTKCTTKKREIL